MFKAKKVFSKKVTTEITWTKNSLLIAAFEKHKANKIIKNNVGNEIKALELGFEHLVCLFQQKNPMSGVEIDNIFDAEKCLKNSILKMYK